MQKRTKIILATASAGILGLAVVGSAVAGHKHRDRGHGMHQGGHGMHQGGHGMHQGGHGMHGGGMGMHRGGHGRGMGRHIRQFAKRYDTDKNGEISQQEIDTNRTDWHKKFDANSDGAINLKEFEALWLEAKRRRMTREFQRLDEDASGTITLQEYTEPMSRIVELMDRNGDGVLSREDRRMRHKRGMKRGADGMKKPADGAEQ